MNQTARQPVSPARPQGTGIPVLHPRPLPGLFPQPGGQTVISGTHVKLRPGTEIHSPQGKAAVVPAEPAVKPRRKTAEEEQRDRMISNLLDDDMSDLTPFLDEKDVTDVSVCDTGRVIISRFGHPRQFTKMVLPEFVVERIIKACSSVTGKPLNSYTGFPVLEALLPKYKARMTGILPPTSVRPILEIRKRPEKIYSLEEYVSHGQMTKEQYDRLCAAIKDRRTVLVCGGTGSGKTTCTNAVIKKMCEYTPLDHFYIVEDTPELQCMAEYRNMLCVSKQDACRAVEESLRFTPDRIIFGEVRTGDVLTALLESWKTGHSGNVTTFHANSAKAAIMRMREMAEHAGGLDTVNHLSEVIQLIVHLRRTPDGIRMDEMIEVDEAMDAKIQALGS